MNRWREPCINSSHESTLRTPLSVSHRRGGFERLLYDEEEVALVLLD